jgi:hypothetical protein
MAALTAADTLLLLADEFAASGAPLQAIKCLEALVRAEPPALPLPEVRARLRLANLLVEFTDNVMSAKQQLERAVRGATRFLRIRGANARVQTRLLTAATRACAAHARSK